MTALKLEKLKEIIGNAYEAGFCGSMELQEEYINEVLEQIKNSDVPNSNVGDWRVYNVKELKQKPLGTLFEHIELGKGVIDTDVTGKFKVMNFSGDLYQITSDQHPWDMPMRELTTG